VSGDVRHMDNCLQIAFNPAKEKAAIDLISKFRIIPPPLVGPLRVGFSGGKDSTVLKHLVERTGIPAKFYFINTTNEAPETIYFVKKHHPDVIILKPKKTFLRKLREVTALPTRFCRWCCRTQKEEIDKICPETIIFIGTRAEESFKRSNYKVIESKKKNKLQIIVRPIHYWAETEIWAYIEKYNLPYNPLYDIDGISRIGCVICPLRTWKNQQVWIKRYPKHYKAICRAVNRHFNKRADFIIGRGCPDSQTMVERWLKGEKIFRSIETSNGTK